MEGSEIILANSALHVLLMQIILAVEFLFFAPGANGIRNPSGNEDKKNDPADDKNQNAA